MSNTNVRRARPEDLDAMLGLMRQLNPDDLPLPDREAVEETWQRMLDSDLVHPLLLQSDGIPAASCVLTIVPNLSRGCRPYALIENVVTHADHRRQGYGRRLMQHALDLAWEAGCYKVMLLSNRDRTEAHAFYRAVGFDSEHKLGFDIRPRA